MRILITGSQSKLGAALVRALSVSHQVRTLDLPAHANGSPPTIAGDPRDREVAAEATKDQDVIVCLVPAVGDYPTELDVLDAATRGTYNLITTASAATRFILLSSLRPFERYPAEWWVTESWAPRPTTDVADLAPYLAELTVREASRVQPLKAIALRLGEVVDDALVSGKAADPRWLHVEDAVQGVERALAFEPADGQPTNGWWDLHLVKSVHGARAAKRSRISSSTSSGRATVAAISSRSKAPYRRRSR